MAELVPVVWPSVSSVYSAVMDICIVGSSVAAALVHPASSASIVRMHASARFVVLRFIIGLLCVMGGVLSPVRVAPSGSSFPAGFPFFTFGPCAPALRVGVRDAGGSPIADEHPPSVPCAAELCIGALVDVRVSSIAKERFRHLRIALHFL